MNCDTTNLVTSLQRDGCGTRDGAASKNDAEEDAPDTARQLRAHRQLGSHDLEGQLLLAPQLRSFLKTL